MTKKKTVFAIAAALGATAAVIFPPACGKSTDAPAWLESDSVAAIHARLLSDFSLTYDSAVAMIKELYPGTTDEDVARFAENHYIEVREIDGVRRVHRKSPRNISLLNPDFNDGRIPARGEKASAERISYVDSVLDYYQGLNPDGIAHSVEYTFEVEVPYDEAIAGETLRVWMPVPMATQRQSGFELLATSQPDYVISTPEQSVHHTLYMEGPAPAPGDTARFSYTARFVTAGQYYSPDFIMENKLPYDTESELYKKYTAFDSPHIVNLDSLARQITGGETDPYLCSEMVYDWIITRYPWAGAREYSTIECIPQYVLDEGHGDCGQVSLLYISLMRSLGIPARWESGWMLHPGEKNLHDWAEVYYEGIGWVPVDVSFGRYINAQNPAARTFYSKGMDAHRFASNQGVGGALYPAKKYLRSETVDFQLGEVETSRGNLFYPGWDSHLRLIKVQPVQL